MKALLHLARLCRIPGSLSLVCPLALLGVGWMARSAPTSAGTTDEQASRDTSAAAALLEPGTDALQFSSEPSYRLDPNGSHIGYLETEACTRDGTECASLVRRAGTGELVSISLHGHRRARTAGDTPLGRGEAVSAAELWMRRLGMDRPAARWDLVGRPVRLDGNWAVRWRAPGRWAFMLIDGRDGTLLCGHTSGLFPLPMRQL